MNLFSKKLQLSEMKVFICYLEIWLKNMSKEKKIQINDKFVFLISILSIDKHTHTQINLKLKKFFFNLQLKKILIKFYRSLTIKAKKLN